MRTRKLGGYAYNRNFVQVYLVTRTVYSLIAVKVGRNCMWTI